MPTIDTEFVTIAYRDSGPRDGTPVLLIHGWPDDASTWDAVVPRLNAGGLRTIQPTLRGFGATRLKGEVPPLSEVASALAMSERSIQRGLRDEDTSYRQLVDEVRKDLALQHLGRPGTSATDVAFLLGFSEPSAFTRAFRRWTGSAPTQFRSA